MLDDSIAAISTSLGEGGVGIVRISGRDAFRIADKVISTAGGNSNWLKESHRMHYGRIADPATGKIIDEVLFSAMKAPKTYTREDVVEINCHGGYIPLKETLRVVLAAGARMAEPGEFTKRAFLNGRIDLAQAEAVIDIIRAKTENALKIAVSQLDGRLSEKLAFIQDKILTMLAGMEAVIDFPEEDIQEESNEKLTGSTGEIIGELEALLKLAATGKIYREGVKTAIIGRPNVGKSSLLNSLLGQERAIVTSIPGTTRDIIQETINIKGIPLVLTDTAGLRETEDLVEKIGVRKARELAREADLLLLVMDAQDFYTQEDKRILRELDFSKTILVINKIDLNETLSYKEEFPIPVVKISSLSGQGMTALEDSIEELITQGKAALSETVIVSRARHEDAIYRANKHMEELLAGFSTGVPLDLLSIDLRSAWEALGEINGSTVTEDLLDRIFSDFCIGK
ncbi:MAG: tRNA uridine-5-carboxymethylaminomethyl(34) synthesis GTPase MnmE [Peptococcaceae bacterium]|nr:tRNA uridine-5-carboxymethylaminomethyl(34) synthesis GTPase MnmE [Peptococcaceae bacterium]